MRFNASAELPVREPFRFDLTVDALRRLAANVVDVVAADGSYYRVLRYGDEAVPIRVRPEGHCTVVAVEKRAHLPFALETAALTFGSGVDLRLWYERSAGAPWLARLSAALRGLKPPRYATLWEACCHSIVFQQISIHAAASIMRRFVEALGERVECGGTAVYAFPEPQDVLGAGDEMLRACGLSMPKVTHLRSVAQAIREGELDASTIETLPTPQAAEYLTRIRGIGPWSAAVVLLRGFGRLDTFPLRDSGVARSLRHLSGESEPDAESLLEWLGPVRGMLYYHLLLGRLRNLLPDANDW